MTPFGRIGDRPRSRILAEDTPRDASHHDIVTYAVMAQSVRLT